MTEDNGKEGSPPPFNVLHAAEVVIGVVNERLTVPEAQVKDCHTFFIRVEDCVYLAQERLTQDPSLLLHLVRCEQELALVEAYRIQVGDWVQHDDVVRRENYFERVEVGLNHLQSAWADDALNTSLVVAFVRKFDQSFFDVLVIFIRNADHGRTRFQDGCVTDEFNVKHFMGVDCIHISSV